MDNNFITNEGNQYLSAEDIKKNKSASGLATAAMIFGIISIFSTCCCMPFIFSGLGITFALLSKRENREWLSSAKTGIITSCVGILVSIILIVVVMVSGLIGAADMDPEERRDFWDEYSEDYERQYGEELPEESYKIYEKFFENLDTPSEL